MNKVCPLLMIGRDRKDVVLEEGVSTGNFKCIGDICAAYRVRTLPKYDKDTGKSYKQSIAYCGLAEGWGLQV